MLRGKVGVSYYDALSSSFLFFSLSLAVYRCLLLLSVICQQWSSCSFCIVISLIVIVRASYLQPWHPPPHEAIWAKREAAKKTYRLLWNKFFDFCVGWCGNYGHMCFTASHGCCASLRLIIHLIDILTGVYSLSCRQDWKCNAFFRQGLNDLCIQSNIALHICSWISHRRIIALFYRKRNVNFRMSKAV